MAQRCVLHLFFNQIYFALVRGYVTEIRLRTTDLMVNMFFCVLSLQGLQGSCIVSLEGMLRRRSDERFI